MKLIFYKIVILCILSSSFASLEEEFLNDNTPSPLENSQAQPYIMDVTHEEEHGTRRFVSFFEGQANQEIYEWHFRASSSLYRLKNLRYEERTEVNILLLPCENVAIARLSKKVTKPIRGRKNKGRAYKSQVVERDEIIDPPYIFVSGLPAKELYSRFEKLSQVNQDKIILCLQRAFTEGKEQHHRLLSFQKNLKDYDAIREEIKQLLTILPFKERLKMHYNSVQSHVMPPPYSDSEQTIRHYIKEILKDNDNAIVDICSWHDVCWRCADCLYSFCVHKNKNVRIRASGYLPYRDFIYTETGEINYSHKPLREDKKNFRSYNNGNVESPYIAHITIDDIKKLTEEGHHE